MRHAVDLDEQVVALPRGQSPVGPAGQFQAALVRSQATSAQLDRLAIDCDAISVRGDLRDGQAVGLPAVAELVGARQRTRRIRPSAAGERVEAGAIIRRVLVGQLDRRLDEREARRGGPGAWPRSRAAGRASRCRSRRARTSGCSSSSSRKPWLVVPPSTHGDRVGERPAQARERLVPVLRPRQSAWRSVESSSARMRSPSATPVSTRSPGPVGSRRWTSRPGAGAKASVGSSAHRRSLDRVPDRRGRVAIEPPARGDVQLKLDEIEPGDRLGHPVVGAETRRSAS